MEKKLIPLLCGLLFFSAPGCGRQPDAKSGLSDRQFAELFAEAVRLHGRYAGQPDSLKRNREALFRRYGVSREDLERFIDTREKDPEKWRDVLQYLEGKIGEEAAASDTLRRAEEKERSHHHPGADTLMNVGGQKGKQGQP